MFMYTVALVALLTQIPGEQGNEVPNGVPPDVATSVPDLARVDLKWLEELQQSTNDDTFGL